MGDLSESIQYGYNAPAKECGRIKMVRISDIHDNEVKWESVPFCDIEESEIQTYQLKKDDILFARTGGTVGKSYIVNDIPEAAVYAGYLIRTRYSKNINAQFMKFFMESNLYWEQLRDGCIATAQPNCNGKTLGNMFIPLPPLEEQQRIVAKIEEVFAEIDAIEKNKELLKTHIKQTRQKILDLAIHGKLVPQDENDEPASILLEKILQEKAQSDNKKSPKKKKTDDITTSDNRPYEKITVENEPFEIPSSWKWVNLGCIGKWQSGTTPSKANPAYYKGGTIPWLNTGDLNDGIISEIPKKVTEKALIETSLRLNNAGAVCIAMYGATIGKLGVLAIPATTNQACCVCDDLEIFVDKMWLFYFLKHHKKEFIEAGFGGAQPNISKDKIVSTRFPLPPIAEQKRIVDKVEELFRSLDEILLHLI